MNFRRMFPSFKLLPLLGATMAIFLATGCWDEEDSNPIPTPTPAPNPTATPTPTPVPTPTPTPSSTPSISGDVALANAEIVEAATNDSVNELLVVEKNLSGKNLTAENLADAQSALANAREAFYLVEASLYYSDPENAAELSALPPKLASVLPSLAIPGFDELESLLSSHLSGNPAPSDIELLAAAKTLRSNLDVLADAWNATALDNFRNTFFLPDPDAPARIFQGIAATMDLIVLSSLAPDKQSQILPRLWTVKDLLEGTYESFNGKTTASTALLMLIEETSPDVAQNITDLLDALILRQTDSNSKGQPVSSTSLEALREELLAAARALGYELESAARLPDTTY